MSVNYSATVINARLNAVVTSLGATGSLVLREGSTVVSQITLSSPAGSVSGGVLTFTGTLLDTAANATGTVDNAVILDSAAATAISGLTVGIPGGSQEIIISNGLNSTLITVGQVVQVLSAQITGS